jgi:hypothetical protein
MKNIIIKRLCASGGSGGAPSGSSAALSTTRSDERSKSTNTSTEKTKSKKSSKKAANIRQPIGNEESKIYEAEKSDRTQGNPW